MVYLFNFVPKNRIFFFFWSLKTFFFFRATPDAYGSGSEPHLQPTLSAMPDL